MPSHKVHAYVDRVNFGKVYWNIHRGMDWPAFYTKKNHRIYFHDVPSVYLIAEKYYPGDPNAIESGLMHLEIDEACTRDPTYRRELEFFAERDIKTRRNQKKKRKQPLPKELKKQEEYLRKILEIQRLHNMITSRSSG